MNLFRQGDAVWYSRKGNVEKATVGSAVNDFQVVLVNYPKEVQGLTHVGHVSFTKEEAEARARRYREITGTPAPVVMRTRLQLQRAGGKFYRRGGVSYCDTPLSSWQAERGSEHAFRLLEGPGDDVPETPQEEHSEDCPCPSCYNRNRHKWE